MPAPNQYTILPPVPDRFWPRVQPLENGCWLWTGPHNRYGQFQNGPRAQGAHRYAYEYSVGAIPDGLHIDHLCCNRLCVNPAHLEPVPRKINNQRFASMRRACKRGHPFNAANTRVNPDGKRACRVCQRERLRRRRTLLAAGAA